MSKRLDYSDFIGKCAPDSVVAIKTYLLFMRRICNFEFKVLPEYQPILINCDRNIDDTTHSSDSDLFRFFYFFYVLSKLNHDIGIMFKMRSKGFDKFSVPEMVANIFEKVSFEVRVGLSSQEIEQAYEIDCNVGGLISAYCDFDKDVITVERIFYNIGSVLQHNAFIESLNFEELGEEISGLADTKENYKNLSPFSQFPTRGNLNDILNSLGGMDDIQMQVYRPGDKDTKPGWDDKTGEFKKLIFSGSKESNKSDVDLGVELTAVDYDENPLVGRLSELRTLKALLLDPVKSAIVYGMPGVGKTTLVKGLAWQIKEGKAHPDLNDKKVYEMSAAKLVAGTRYRGDFEDRLSKIAERLAEQGNVIWFIDEIHTLMGLGQPDNGSLDASNILKPYLGDGRIKLIGGTTPREYAILEKDPAFDRRFNGFEIKEPNEEEVFALIENYISRYERLYSLGFECPKDARDNILRLIIALSKEIYQDERKRLCNPDLSLTILNLAYNFARVDGIDHVDKEHLIEGISFSNHINEKGKEFFMQEVKKYNM